MEPTQTDSAEDERDLTPEITILLRAAAEGDDAANERLWQAIYNQLKGMARGSLKAHGDQLLQPTVLVHEAWIKLERNLAHFSDRQHFFRTAARAMRQVFANYAKAAKTKKRDARRIQISTMSDVAEAETFDATAVNEALDQLESLNERHARVVELRFLCSFTIEQAAEALGVSHTTVESDWAMARAWLRRQLKPV